MRYFDCRKAAKKAKLTKGRLAVLTKLMRREFPADDMMFELHLLRACMAAGNARMNLDKLLRNSPR